MSYPLTVLDYRIRIINLKTYIELETESSFILLPKEYLLQMVNGILISSELHLINIYLCTNTLILNIVFISSMLQDIIDDLPVPIED